MASNYREWSIQLIDGRLNKPIDDDAGVYNVMAENDPSEVTLYSNDSGTAGNNPGTLSNGRMRFFTDSGTTAVDISVLTTSGHAFFLESVGVSDGRIVVWPEKIENTLIIPYQIVGASEAVVDSGFDILSNMLIKDVFIHVTTLGTGAVLDIGTSTDADGFADGVSAATTGYPATLIEEALVSSSGLTGALLANITGSNVRKFHVRANATSGANIVYSNTTSSSTAGEGFIYITYYRLVA